MKWRKLTALIPTPETLLINLYGLVGLILCPLNAAQQHFVAPLRGKISGKEESKDDKENWFAGRDEP